MTAARRGSSSKAARSIPVKVTVDPRPAPTSLPPLPHTAIVPAPKKVAPSLKQKVKKSAPLKVMRQPVHEWSEQKRRQIMWWLVIGGTVVAVIIWLSTIRNQFSGNENQPNIFREAGQLLKSIRWPSTPKPSPAEQEHQQLDQQVFPQFQQ